MTSIGIRELRQFASRFLRRVEQGESFEITDRGRPVALLVPVPAGTEVDRLTASGRLEAARGDLLELGEPLEPAPSRPLPSEDLAELRSGER
jgi:prevent-host-death family protein